MTSIVLGLIVILIPLYLIFQIINDVVLRNQRVFSYFEFIVPSLRIRYSLASFVFILSLWSLLSFGRFVEPSYLPTPTATVAALWESMRSGELLINASSSLVRVLVGFCLAGGIGIVFGSLAGTFARFQALILPISSAIRYVPPTAFISLTIIWFGIGETSKVALIFLGIIFYVVQMVADIIKLVPRVFVEAAESLGANRAEVFWKVIMSMSFPDLLAVLRVNLGAAWTFLIVAELVAAQRGLGYLMAVSQRFLQTPKLFAIIVVVGILGFLSDGLLAIIIGHYSKWKTTSDSSQ